MGKMVANFNALCTLDDALRELACCPPYDDDAAEMFWSEYDSAQTAIVNAFKAFSARLKTEIETDKRTTNYVNF